ncbi:hypothetical protein [Paraliomyxa miuraensis]|uniref:hypothetical protein n=1 Tax=Paraliomyxa miuraensis TaxID=376150 RepID=UPI0022578E92|nr:hypothetical protein [Paraliomyxa miuraensis]MCX4245049.1 hypothetical protein [Paraliomyxa miuraensis]
MTNHDPDLQADLQPDLQRARIDAELAALGEDPADDEEFTFVASDPSMHDDVHEADVRTADVRTVATLVGLSRWDPPADGLSALERHRVWRRVEARIPALPTIVAEPGPAAANDAASSGWRGVVASLALVASVTLVLHVPVAPPLSPEDRDDLRSAGELARAQLQGAAAPSDRARELAQRYEARLRAARGAE